MSLCVTGGAGAADDDDVITSINEGMEYYKEGEYAEATSSLNYAVQLIQQKKGESLSGLLPEPLDGWTAAEAKSQAAGAAMFGGGVTAEREYSKDSSRIAIKIVTDSPMLQGVMMMFSNPMFATADGAKMERIGRQKAIVKYTPANKSGTIQIVVKNRFLVSVEGNDVSREELLDYAKATDLKKMADLP
ncbi:MAG: hypothetical protein ACE5FQ_12280 [Thiogranum sp.]